MQDALTEAIESLVLHALFPACVATRPALASYYLDPTSIETRTEGGDTNGEEAKTKNHANPPPHDAYSVFASLAYRHNDEEHDDYDADQDREQDQVEKEGQSKDGAEGNENEEGSNEAQKDRKSQSSSVTALAASLAASSLGAERLVDRAMQRGHALFAHERDLLLPTPAHLPHSLYPHQRQHRHQSQTDRQQSSKRPKSTQPQEEDAIVRRIQRRLQRGGGVGGGGVGHRLSVQVLDLALTYTSAGSGSTTPTVNNRMPPPAWPLPLPWLAAESLPFPTSSSSTTSALTSDGNTREGVMPQGTQEEAEVSFSAVRAYVQHYLRGSNGANGSTADAGTNTGASQVASGGNSNTSWVADLPSTASLRLQYTALLRRRHARLMSQLTQEQRRLRMQNAAISDQSQGVTLQQLMATTSSSPSPISGSSKKSKKGDKKDKEKKKDKHKSRSGGSSKKTRNDAEGDEEFTEGGGEGEIAAAAEEEEEAAFYAQTTAADDAAHSLFHSFLPMSLTQMLGPWVSSSGSGSGAVHADIGFEAQRYNILITLLIHSSQS